MSHIRDTRTLIIAALVGFILALASTSHGQPAGSLDAGATESASDAPADSGSEAAPKPETAESGPATAPEEAETAPEPNPAKEDPAGAAMDVYKSLKAGEWLVAFGGALMFLVWGIRALLIWLKVRWVKTRWGGFVVSFGTSFALATGIALNAGAGLSLGLFTAAAVAAWGAAGGRRHLQGMLGKLEPKSEES